MTTVNKGVIVVETTRSPEFPGMIVTRMYHLDMPELRGEGGSLHEAADALMRYLVQELSRISDSWHREMLEQIIAQVREYMADTHQPTRSLPSGEEWWGNLDDLM